MMHTQSLESSLIFGEEMDPLGENIKNICKHGDKQKMFSFLSDNSNSENYVTHHFLLHCGLVGACMGEHLELVETLLSLGAEISEEALEVASVTGNMKIMKMLVENDNVFTDMLTRPYYVACASNQLTVMNLLLDHGVSKEVYLYGLFYAFEHGCPDIVEYWLNRLEKEKFEIEYFDGLLISAIHTSLKVDNEYSEVSYFDYVSEKIKSRLSKTNNIQLVNYIFEQKSVHQNQDLDKLLSRRGVDLIEMLNNGFDISLFIDHPQITKAKQGRCKIICEVIDSLQDYLHGDILKFCVTQYVPYH